MPLSRQSIVAVGVDAAGGAVDPGALDQAAEGVVVGVDGGGGQNLNEAAGVAGHLKGGLVGGLALIAVMESANGRPFHPLPKLEES